MNPATEKLKDKAKLLLTALVSIPALFILVAAIKGNQDPNYHLRPVGLCMVIGSSFALGVIAGNFKTKA